MNIQNFAPRSGSPQRQRVAIVGSGISGLASAWLLKDKHDVTLFEAADRIGGHSNTVDIQVDGKQIPVDMGFIVFNRPNYPHLVKLFQALGVATQPTDMSFGVSLGKTAEAGALEYSSRSGALGLFAQRRNLANPRYLQMLMGTWRYMRDAKAHLERSGEVSLGEAPVGKDTLSLGAFLDAGGYPKSVVEDHILPMAAAIWSGTANRLRDFPAHTYFQFFRNHGLLGLNDWLQWETVSKGTRSYVSRLVETLPEGSVRTNAGVKAVRRDAHGVWINAGQQPSERFDQVIFACHSDEARALLGENATQAESDILGGVGFQDNVAYLHRDLNWLPKRKAAWAAWNYVGARRSDLNEPATVSYWMNLLQDLSTETPVVLTLNPKTEIPDEAIWHKASYRHPQFDSAAIAAQKALPAIQGENFSWFTGAWTGFGFHEDGMQSAVSVARAFGCAPDWDADVTEISSAATIANGARLRIPTHPSIAAA